MVTVNVNQEDTESLKGFKVDSKISFVRKMAGSIEKGSGLV